MMEFFDGLLSFVMYFGFSLAAVYAFKVIYTLATPQDEWKLIKEDQNVAAGIAFGGAILGFCMALSGAAANSLNILDYAMWAAVALGAQILAFYLVRVSMPKIVERIEGGEVPAAVVLAAVSVGVGALNAACMTY